MHAQPHPISLKHKIAKQNKPKLILSLISQQSFSFHSDLTNAGSRPFALWACHRVTMETLPPRGEWTRENIGLSRPKACALVWGYWQMPGGQGSEESSEPPHLQEVCHWKGKGEMEEHLQKWVDWSHCCFLDSGNVHVWMKKEISEQGRGQQLLKRETTKKGKYFGIFWKSFSGLDTSVSNLSFVFTISNLNPTYQSSLILKQNTEVKYFVYDLIAKKNWHGLWTQVSLTAMS